MITHHRIFRRRVRPLGRDSGTPRNSFHIGVIGALIEAEAALASGLRLMGAPSSSNQRPLDLIQRHFLRAPVVELRRARARTARHLRRALQLPAVLEIGGDARRPKRLELR